MKLIKNKRFLILYSLLTISLIIFTFFMFNNERFYEKTIAKITDIEEKHIKTNTDNDYGYKIEIYEQKIKAIIKNGPDKNSEILIKNEYHKGEVYSQKYRKNDEIFVSLNKKDNKIINAHIEGYKRDKYIVLISSILILTIILIGHLKGFLAIISVIANIVIFNLIIYFNVKGYSLVWLSYIASILFSIICLTLVSGLNKKTLAAIISSCCGITVTLLIIFLVIKITNYSGIRFEQMELLTRPYEGIFISEIIMGGLGAIMDISITIASSLNEIIEKSNQVTLKELVKSGRNIGQDVTSTMINVLFFTYICGSIPNLALYLRNGITISSLLNEFISLEMTRALTGAIGISTTIIISIFITTLLYRKRLYNE